MLCKYCDRECKNDNSLRNHERLCNDNPSKMPRSQKWLDAMHLKKGKAANQWTKAAETGIPYILKDETRKKISDKSKNHVWDENARKKHSVAMKKTVEENPDSYTSSNRGRAKQILYDGIKFIGNWELDFYKWCKNNNFTIERCFESFAYEWNGSRKYFPDFYLPDINVYVEVKGYETERDRAKWDAFPKTLRIIKKDEITRIRKNTFSW